MATRAFSKCKHLILISNGGGWEQHQMRRAKHWSAFLHDWSDLARYFLGLEYPLSKWKTWGKPKITTQYIKKERINHLLHTYSKGERLKNKTNKKTKTKKHGLLETLGQGLGQGPQDLSAALPFYTVAAGNVWRMQLCKLTWSKRVSYRPNPGTPWLPSFLSG